jgi:putative flippase GtrA
MDRPSSAEPQPAVLTRANLAVRRSQNWLQLLQFCVVGGVGYVVNLGVYSALVHWVDIHYIVAATLSFCVAVTNNYLLNRQWTFRRNRGGVAQQGARFLVVSLVSLAANLLILRGLVSAGLAEVPAQAIAIVLVTPLNFVGNKLWSFRRG